jgi:hypothetical protein
LQASFIIFWRCPNKTLKLLNKAAQRGESQTVKNLLVSRYQSGASRGFRKTLRKAFVMVLSGAKVSQGGKINQSRKIVPDGK